MSGRDRVFPYTVQLANIRDVESWCRGFLGRRLPNGMFLRPDEFEDELSEMFAQLVDWFRPVAEPWCGAWTRNGDAGEILMGSGCGHRRGEQHGWDCDALPPQRIRRDECLGCGTPKYAHGPATEAGDLPLAGHPRHCRYLGLDVRRGCFTCGHGRGDRHSHECPHRRELQQRYDPGKTDDFALFARFRITTYYIPDLCRRLLGRSGGRIAERSHAELDERAEPGHRPWEAVAPEQDGVRADRGGAGERDQAERARAVARGRALLGL